MKNKFILVVILFLSIKAVIFAKGPSDPDLSREPTHNIVISEEIPVDDLGGISLFSLFSHWLTSFLRRTCSPP